MLLNSCSILNTLQSQTHTECVGIVQMGCNKGICHCGQIGNSQGKGTTVAPAFNYANTLLITSETFVSMLRVESWSTLKLQSWLFRENVTPYSPGWIPLAWFVLWLLISESPFAKYIHKLFPLSLPLVRNGHEFIDSRLLTPWLDIFWV